MLRVVGFTAGAAAAGLAFRLVVTGAATLDTGVGRRLRPLGPLEIAIAAPPEVVFDVIAGPYRGRTPRAMSDKLEVLERGGDMVVAAHRTPVGRRLVATTVESVRFDRPATVDFRLLRGPVPHVVERFTLHDADGSTRLEYRGELGTDGWAAGRWWGDVVAKRWVATVQDSLARVQVEAERRAG
jgi:Polyketide cyclase / dehydrase and lipid transport